MVIKIHEISPKGKGDYDGKVLWKGKFWVQSGKRRSDA